MSITAEPLVRMLSDLVALPSQNPGDDERAVAEYLAEHCRYAALLGRLLGAAGA